MSDDSDKKRVIASASVSEGVQEFDAPRRSPVFDERLLERAYVQWQFGDWESLTALDDAALRSHPERGKLALLAAAAYLQTGRVDASRLMIRLAKDWGCSESALSQILIAGVYNSLGRASAAIGQTRQALHYFERSISVGAPGTDARLIIGVRMAHQLEQLSVLEKNRDHARLSSASFGVTTDATRFSESNAVAAGKFLPDVYASYQNLSRECLEGGDAPFILLDSKSIPRSGLHFLKNSLGRVLGDCFSFCEWYQEPGCCRTTPCRLIGYATECKKKRVAGVRLVKSHDFSLGDAAFPPLYSARRLVLVRNPLFLLTSWFSLSQLRLYEGILKRNGIGLEKIWLLHEPSVLASAYQLVDQHFVEPKPTALQNWLSDKTKYISGFAKKWIAPLVPNVPRFSYLVRYEEMDSFIFQLIDEIEPKLPKDSKRRYEEFRHASSERFDARKDPFLVNSKKISAYLTSHAKYFVDASREIVLGDESGFLGQHYYI